MRIDLARTDEELLAAYPVLHQLRPKLERAAFLATVRRMEGEGFRLASLRDPDVRAVAGFRVMELFATGRLLYVDDLVTDAAHRSRGYGKALLDWLVAEAGRAGCASLELDSGLHAEAAHRFYRRVGLEETNVKFSIPIARDLA